MQIPLQKIWLELHQNPSDSISIRCIGFDFSVLLTSLRLAVPWFPSLGLLVLIEIHAISHAARVPGQKFVVPHLAPSRKFLEPLGITESADQIALCDLADTGFEFIHPRMAAR